MASKGNKFGAFKGVFTPSILTILGVIMYLRLPWIVGEAGLIATIGIILVAHLISVSTGLSVASIATDKRVETGGTYFMISRSLGLPIGGTLGLALFVGLSFSVSLYLIGFSETFLTAMGFETTLNNIRIAGTITLIAVTVLTFISTSLALKTQFVILAVMILSLVSIFFGRHEFAPSEPLIETASSALPWIALFAVFFPAVTGFEAGVSMSGDLRDPKKSIPKGTISAILVGLMVYLGLAFFFSFTVSRDLLREPSVLYQISLFSPLIVAGIWGATLSSALGSILGAPRILQATAIDRITPKFFAKGFGAGNEPRNALFLTFLIAFAGIMIGDLNAIARIVTIFFIITYGFLNLTCAIENIAGSDFRPSFRVPAWAGFLGAFACFVIMIQLDVIAMLGAIIILGAVFLFLKRRELTLQSGDAWRGIWSTLVKTGLYTLSEKAGFDKRNWRPNIILFSGSASARPHLISMARTIVGKLGVFTNFELVEEKTDKKLFSKAGTAITGTDSEGKKIFTRQHICKDIYEGISTISKVYGFTGFEPNTILMGWGKSTAAPDKFTTLIEDLHKLDYNLALLNYHKVSGFGKRRQIDLWWSEGSNNLNFGITLLRFLTSDPRWRQAVIRVLFISRNSSLSEKVQSIIRQILDDQRTDGNIVIIENSVEKKPIPELIRLHSKNTDLTILDFELGGKLADIKTFNSLNSILEVTGTTLIIRANENFERIKFSIEPGKTLPETPGTGKESTLALTEQIPYPEKELLAQELYSIANDFDGLHKKYALEPFDHILQTLKKTANSLEELNTWAISTAEKNLKEPEVSVRSRNLVKLLSDFLFQAEQFVKKLDGEFLPSIKESFGKATNIYLSQASERLQKVPEKVAVKYDWTEFKAKEGDELITRIGKLRKLYGARIFKKQVTRKTPLRRIMALYLIAKRKETNYELLQKIGIAIYTLLSEIRRNLIETNEIIQNKVKLADDLVSANIELKEGKNRLDEINEQIMQQLSENFLAISQQTLNDLFTDFEKISFMLGNPETDRRIRKYERIFSRKKYQMDSMSDPDEIIAKNLQLYINKIHTELILQSLKARLKSKLAKQAEDLEIMIASRVISPLGKIKEMAINLQSGKINLKSKDFLQEIKLYDNFDLNILFERFFKDIQTIISDLPETIEITQPDFINEVERGEFPESSVEIIELRKRSSIIIGRDMTNNLRIELSNTEEKLNNVLKNISDIIRLMVFNLENIANENIDENTGTRGQIEGTLIEELITRIEGEEKKTGETYNKTITNLNALLDKSFEPLSSDLLSGREKPSGIAQKKGRLPELISRSAHTFRKGLQKQWVKIIYTRSEGMLFMKRISKLQEEKKSSYLAVYEILETLSPNPGITKKLPFYYANLFAGNSTINKDLWVGMRKQLLEAETAIQRFRQGYGGALLITGERNSGKSSLSRYVARDFSSDDKGYIIRAPKEGSCKSGHFIQAIQQALNSTLDLNYLLEIQPEHQVFVINDLELWWERTAEGSEALDEIFRLIDRFGKKHLFIVNCRNWAWELLNRAYKLEKHFFARIDCEPFDAKELKEIIMFRHRAGGLKFRLNKKDEDAFNEYDYAQLFNRYFTLSDGNPGYTVRAWISNIIYVSGKNIEIRMPEVPDTSYLSELGQETYMVLLQFILHRRITVQKLSRVLRLSETQTADIIYDLRRLGLVEEKFTEVFALNPMIEPFLVNQIRQKKLL